LICAAAIVITETITKSGKTVQNIRNKDSSKLRIQRQVSNWRKELSILPKSGTHSNNIKLNIKKRFFFRNMK
jgi:hypothetical protein